MNSTALPTFWSRPLVHEPTLAELVNQKYLSPDTAAWLTELVKLGGRILVTGSSDTGKTLLADALTAHVPLGVTVGRVSRTPRSLARHGLGELDPHTDPAAVGCWRIDDDTDAVVGTPGSMLATLRAATIPALETKLGVTLTSLRFDAVVVVSRTRDESGTKRFTSAVMAPDGASYQSVEMGYVDPWGVVTHKPTAEAATLRTNATNGARETAPSTELLNLGTSTRGSALTLSREDLMRSVLAVGATGSGISLAVTTLVRTAREHADVLVLTSEDRLTMVQEFGRVDQLTDATSANLLTGLDVRNAVDVLMRTATWATAYYEVLSRTILTELLTVLSRAHTIDPVAFKPPSLTRVVEVLSASSLPAAIKPELAALVRDGGVTRADFRSLSGQDKEYTNQALVLGAQLTNLALAIAPDPTRSQPALDVDASGLSVVSLGHTQHAPALRAVLRRLRARTSTRDLVVVVDGRSLGFEDQDSPVATTLAEELNTNPLPVVLALSSANPLDRTPVLRTFFHSLMVMSTALTVEAAPLALELGVTPEELRSLRIGHFLLRTPSRALQRGALAMPSNAPQKRRLSDS